LTGAKKKANRRIRLSRQTALAFCLATHHCVLVAESVALLVVGDGEPVGGGHGDGGRLLGHRLEQGGRFKVRRDHEAASLFLAVWTGDITKIAEDRRCCPVGGEPGMLLKADMANCG
jgi:hypothetical protein